MAHMDVLCPACGKAMVYTRMVRGYRYVLDEQYNKVAMPDDEVVCTWTCYCQGGNCDAITEQRTVPVEQLPAVET